ncbi:MAG: hypothetical protein QE278_02350 [Limnobacter sp.]|nr:hypothetical protein [Limnobacter sp.]
MPAPKPAPLQVLLPDALIPQAMVDRLAPDQAAKLFQECPKGLAQVLSRNQASAFHNAGSLDRVEAWLYSHLSGNASETPLEGDFYPPWAMCSDLNANHDQVQAHTRWWGSVGSLTLERDGVSFTPVEALHVTPAELDEFWALVWPLLQANGWQGVNQSESNLSNVLLQSDKPVPMQQASPWSVQNIRLTDYLPMSDECADWRRMWLKLQVELKQAAFNLKREAAGQPTLNCLWFWGGGAHMWQPQVQLPKLYSVSADGLYPATKMTHEGNQALNRLLFWKQVLSPFFDEEQQHTLPKSTLYCLDFHGWGASAKAFRVLESEVIQPMQIAGLGFEWILMGQQGWRSIQSNWLGRFKFWKNKPDWSAFGEPDVFQGPTEEDLQDAWEAGQREQQRIQSDFQ